MWCRGASWSVAPAVIGGLRPDFSGYFAPVGHDGERKGDEEDADAPGEGDPDCASDRLLLEQGSNRVDDRGDRLVFCEGTHGPGIEAVGTNGELTNGRKMSGYEKAAAPSTDFADNPAITASH